MNEGTSISGGQGKGSGAREINERVDKVNRE